MVAQAMRDGAFGLSTGLFYVPGTYTPTEAVIELAKVAGRMGGIHISHMRQESSHILDSVRETIRIGDEARLSTRITHHKNIGKAGWGLSVETLRLVEEARARGVDVTIDAYPYTACSTGISALFPAGALEGGQKALLERLGAPNSRVRIKAAIAENIRVDRGAGDPANIGIVSCRFDRALAGKNLAELTRARGVEPDVGEMPPTPPWNSRPRSAAFAPPRGKYLTLTAMRQSGNGNGKDEATATRVPVTAPATLPESKVPWKS